MTLGAPSVRIVHEGGPHSVQVLISLSGIARGLDQVRNGRGVDVTDDDLAHFVGCSFKDAEPLHPSH